MLLLQHLYLRKQSTCMWAGLCGGVGMGSASYTSIRSEELRVRGFGVCANGLLHVLRSSQSWRRRTGVRGIR